MKLLSGFVITSLMFFSAQLRAGSVQVGQWFPWEFVNQEINQIPVSLQYQNERIEINYANLKPVFKNIQIQLDGQFVDNQFSDSGVQNLFQAQTQVEIEEINIDQIVQRQIAGNILNIKMKAICYGFKVEIPNFQVALSSSYRPESNYWIPQLNHVDVEIPLSSWTKGTIQCLGPNGIDQYLSQLVDEQLRNPVFIEKVLKDWMSEQIQNKWVRLWKNLLVATENNFFDVQMNFPQKQGVSIYGKIPLSNSNEVRLPPHISMDHIVHLTQPSVILTQEVLTALIQDQISQIISKRHDLQEIKPFRKLMSSRFMQFFAWPDLMNFGKRTPFYLSSKPEQQVLKMEKVLNSDSYRIQFQFLGKIESERDSKKVDYIDWAVGLSSQIRPEIVQSTIRLNFNQTKSQMNFKMNEDYVQSYKPNQRMPKKTILKSIEAILQTPQLTYSLPEFQWKNKVWKMHGLIESKELLIVPWIQENSSI